MGERSQMPLTSGPDRRPLKMRTFHIARLGAIVFAAFLIAPFLAGAQPGDRQGGPSHPSDPSDARTCARCHSSLVSHLSVSPHVRRTNAKDLTCSICHGSQKDHVASGGEKSKEIDPASGTQKEVDQVCLSCHRGTHSGFDRSPHGRSGLGCTACHSIHGGDSSKSLLKAPQPELCYQCHAQVKPQFDMPSRHNVRSGLVQCTDCHDPHGTRQEERPGASYRQDTFCTDCHTSTAGPFLFEHAVVKTEGCTACHLPHGGPNPHLLIRAKVDAVCQSCHFPSPNLNTGAHIPPAKDHAEHSKSCTDCHADIHGSNRDFNFLNAR